MGNPVSVRRRGRTSSPRAVVAASARLTRLGLVAHRPNALERLLQIDTVFLDEAGALIQGIPVFHSIETFDEFPRARALGIASALMRATRHPIATAFKSITGPQLTATDVSEMPGQGLQGRVLGKVWRLGELGFVLNQPTVGQEPGIFLGGAAGVVASVVLENPVRSTAKASIAALQALGVNVFIALDNQRASLKQITHPLGFERVIDRTDPAQLLALVQEQQQAAHRLLVIGDRISDAPALAAAHVSCAMAQGPAGSTHAAADLLLLNNSLHAVAEGLRIVRLLFKVLQP